MFSNFALLHSSIVLSAPSDHKHLQFIFDINEYRNRPRNEKSACDATYVNKERKMSAIICYSSPLNRSWDLDDDYANGKWKNQK